MKKDVISRCIFWGIILVIVLIIGSAGVVSFYSGYGTQGKIRYKLKPVCDSFNELNSLDKYSNVGIDIKCHLKADKLAINYSTNNDAYSFEYVYEDSVNGKILKSVYDNKNELIGKLVLEHVIDAISVANGYLEGDVFSVFTLDDFYKTTIKQGVLLEKDNVAKITNIYLNLDVPILSSLNEIENEKNKNEFINNIQSLHQITTQYYETNKKAIKYFYNPAGNCLAEGITITKLIPVDNIKYYINIDNNGKYIEFYVLTDKFAYSYKNEDDLDNKKIDVINIDIDSNNYNNISTLFENVCVK